MTVVSPTGRLKSVRNCCVFEVLVEFLCCPLVFEFSVGIGFFFIGLSQISFFFLFLSVLFFIIISPIFNSRINSYYAIRISRIINLPVKFSNCHDLIRHFET